MFIDPLFYHFSGPFDRSSMPRFLPEKRSMSSASGVEWMVPLGSAIPEAVGQHAT